MSDCQLKEPPFYQCCCNCVFHLRVDYPCTKENHEKGLCFTQQGWACVWPLMDSNPEARVTFPWHEHSVGCELWTPNDKFKLIIDCERIEEE